MDLSWQLWSSPLGPMLLACRSADGAVVRTVFVDPLEPDGSLASTLERLTREGWTPRSRTRELGGLRRHVRLLLDGPLPPSAERPTLVPYGTRFQRRVWTAVRRVGFGRTITYGELAGRVGLPRAVRACAAAIAANPFVVLVPSHRVVSRSGAALGFGGGVQVKEALLRRERQRARESTRRPT